MLVLGGAVFAALAQVFVRKLVQTERTATVVFWFSATASGLALVTIPFGWVIEAVLATSLLAPKSLRDAVRAVAAALPRSLRELDAPARAQRALRPCRTHRSRPRSLGRVLHGRVRLRAGHARAVPVGGAAGRSQPEGR